MTREKQSIRFLFELAEQGNHVAKEERTVSV